ncbi:MAG: DUF1499 domain-containing protein [Thiotrichales bacterium]|nr:DUF1499 domain-containing protein [Thiotrichales bacterium]
MKIALIVLFVFIGLFLTFLVVSANNSKTGQALGLIDGSLAPCGDKPNCLCSAYKDDSDHFLSPIELPQNLDIDLQVIKNSIEEIGGVIHSENGGYIVASFSSALFGFVDDFEVQVDLVNHVLQVRSASRVGYSDGGANKKRIELFRKTLSKNF